MSKCLCVTVVFLTHGSDISNIVLWHKTFSSFIRQKILSAWLYVEGHMRGHWLSHFNQEGVVPLSRGLSFNKVCKYTCILNVCLTPLLALCDSSLVNTSLDHTLIMVSRG